jgi:hypothetical protein
MRSGNRPTGEFIAGGGINTYAALYTAFDLAVDATIGLLYYGITCGQ